MLAAPVTHGVDQHLWHTDGVGREINTKVDSHSQVRTGGYRCHPEVRTSCAQAVRRLRFPQCALQEENRERVQLAPQGEAGMRTGVLPLRSCAAALRHLEQACAHTLAQSTARRSRRGSQARTSMEHCMHGAVDLISAQQAGPSP
jgi:hypothetical protein